MMVPPGHILIINWLPYSGKFSLVQIFAEKRPDSSEEIFTVFIFADAGRFGHTPTSWWPRLICETALNDEAKKNACATTAWSAFCVEAFAITKVSRLPPRARNRRIGFSTADLGFDNFGTSHGFVGILYSGRLPFLYSNHLEGRQTEENHLVHIGTNSYRRMHVVTSQFPS